MRRSEVVVVGGGMVGACTAAALARAGVAVDLVEPAPPVPGEGLEVRVSALTVASERILAALGAWERIEPGRRAPFRRIRVWEGDAPGTRFDADATGADRLGHIVENRAVRLALWQVLQTLPTVRIHAGAGLAGLVVGAREACLRLTDGTRLAAPLVVGADGARSGVRRLAGIATVGWPYRQRTIVGHVTTSRRHRDTAWQRFLPTGPVAFLPLADGRCSLAWHNDEGRAEALMALEEADFLAALEAASGGVLGEMLAIEGRAAFPLHLRHAVRYHAPRVALVGDAAHTVHPLAGQGVNLGLLDAATLAEEVAAAVLAGDDPGEPALLARYERRRRPHNLAAAAVMDGFKRCFGNRSPALAWARRAGLALADRAGPLKTGVMRLAMGLDGPLPALARGGGD
ncbi:UbiH/UbiF/VisC/COQ6 family ubiquinone biosynthesis hydroxylase [Inmirania thermothiophila]|uniref:2-octaprenylphenol hydroxylase n=1 Tax=Inmirania thermothiophila TaxID=1750597 RepID=A0A3N1Y5R6_9GAMM|nr:UbiH/UbiF/VisC/COQ6 family ubiquinone biosynthesis hydroxylase [Inmirania thermothiophila]ROR34156.1 2-octaprenylphenol hydroxylase [Inmirania thermothiophila]